MKTIDKILIILVAIAICSFNSKNIQEGAIGVEDIMSKKDLYKIVEAEKSNDKANDLLGEANLKILELGQKQTIYTKDKAKLTKKNEELKKKGKFKQKFSRKLKNEIKVLEEKVKKASVELNGFESDVNSLINSLISYFEMQSCYKF